jgi:microcystin-dependent protein
MTAPLYVLRSYGGGAFPTQLADAMLDSDLSFILTGPFVNWPTGSGGPFTLAMDDGLPTVEKILCSALDTSSGTVTVYTNGDFTGRGYDGTSANAHTPQAAPNPQCRPCWTAEEAQEANVTANAVMGGAVAAPDGYVLTVESGVPSYIAPGGSSGGLVPIGTVLPFAGAVAPSGYHICDGTAISRTTYSALFAVIGTTWGPGDGSTTYNIPDLRDRFALGANVQPLGATGGSNTITDANMPAHYHPGSTVTINDPTHDHTPTGGFEFVVGTTTSSTIYTNNGSNIDHSPSWNLGATPTTTSNATGITANNVIALDGGGTAYQQPFAAVNQIIRIT